VFNGPEAWIEDHQNGAIVDQSEVTWVVEYNVTSPRGALRATAAVAGHAWTAPLESPTTWPSGSARHLNQRRSSAARHGTSSPSPAESRTSRSCTTSSTLRQRRRLTSAAAQVEACRRIFASNTNWTVVRGSDLEEGESQGFAVWRRHVGDPVLQSNKTRRVD
jgi:hypothetical protein